MRWGFGAWVIVFVLACGGDDPPAGDAVTVLRDEYGVPHVFAPDLAGAAHAMGWVDAEDQRELLLEQIYAGDSSSARRLGASCDEACVTTDLGNEVLRVREIANMEYPRLAERTRAVLDAWVAGVNAYFAQLDPPSPHWSASDPVTPVMVVGAALALRNRHAVSATQTQLDPTPGGSNQFGVTGAHTAADTTIFSKDPHNLWGSSERYVHVSFEGYEIFGNAAFGIMLCGSNDALAFGCTRAAPASAVAVRADLQIGPDDPGDATCGPHTQLSYFDHAAGGFVPFDTRCIDVDPGTTGADGNRWVFESRFGPLAGLLDPDGDGTPDEALIVHVFASEDASFLDYFVDRSLARSADEFLALFAAPTPRDDAQYRGFATAEHQIGMVLGAGVPALDPALDWTQPVDSADSRIDSWTPNSRWAELDGVVFHDIDGSPPELPHVVDPIGDFVQNCNGGPTHATEPTGQMGPIPTILEMRTEPTERGVRLRELLSGTGIDGEAAREIALDIEVPHARALVSAIECALAAEAIDPVAAYGDGGELMNVLRGFVDDDFQATPDSIAATVLFLVDQSATSEPSYPAPGACLTRAQLDGLGAALRDAVAPYMRSTYAADHDDPFRVPWGYVNRAVVAGRDVGLPGMGGRLATLFSSFFAFDAATGRAVPGLHGGSRVPQVTVYGPEGVSTFISVPQGQTEASLFPSSPHVGQTIDDFVARRFRQLPLDRAEVEASLCPWGDDPGHEHPSRTTLHF